MRTCAHCGSLWAPAEQDFLGESHDPAAAPTDDALAALCPVCERLGQALTDATKLPEVAVVCTICGSLFAWEPEDQRRYIETQERRWVPRVCARCQRARSTQETEDLRGLAVAGERLREAYVLLKPSLRDPEKLSLRYQRVIQRAQWVVSTYSRHFPPDMVYRFQGAFGGAYPSSAFDQSVPGKRSVLRLRAFVREILDHATHGVAERGGQDELW